MYTVTIKGEKKQYPHGTTYEDIAAVYQSEYENMIVEVAANGNIRELFKKVTRDCELQFFTMKDDVGYKTYVRTATMLFLKGVFDLFGNETAQECRVQFAVGHGSFINPQGRIPATAENAEKIKQKMQEAVERKLPFMKRSYQMDDAMELFREQGMKDKEKLFRYRRSSFVNIYEIEGYYDYYYG